MRPGCAGLFICIVGLAPCGTVLVIVDEIHVLAGAVLKAEDNPPVRPDSDRVKALAVALHSVKAQRREIDVRQALGNRKNRENVLDALDMVGIDPAPVAALVQPLQPLMPEAFNHCSSCEL